MEGGEKQEGGQEEGSQGEGGGREGGGEMERRKEGGKEVWRRGRGCSGNSRAFQAIPMLSSLASSVQARETGLLLQPLPRSLSTASALLPVYSLCPALCLQASAETPGGFSLPHTVFPVSTLHTLPKNPLTPPVPQALSLSFSFIHLCRCLVLLRPDFSCLLPRHLSSRNDQSRHPPS